MGAALSRFALVPLLFCLLAACGSSQSQDKPKEKKPVAIVGGQTIYEDELLPRVQSDLRQLRQQEHQIKSRALESLILERLLEAEAKKRGTDINKLIQLECDAKVPEPTQAELEVLYEQQKDELKGKFEEVRGRLRESWRQTRIQQARQHYFRHLWDSAGISILLEPPRDEVAYDPARVRGNPSAPVVIVEFSDFQCPFCHRVQPALMAVLEKYKGQVKLAYLDFPLGEIHSEAQSAAEASRCAGEQGKFWEYHDLLFAKPGSLERRALLAHAQTLSLDQERFVTCLGTGKYKDAVEEDFQAGQRAGVNGTPAFFVNGIFLEGAKPASAFERIIDSELAALKKSTPR